MDRFCENIKFFFGKLAKAKHKNMLPLNWLNVNV